MTRRRPKRHAAPPARETARRASDAHGLPAHRAAQLLGTLPLVAVLWLLAPYLWPLDHAPTAEFSDIHHLHLPYVELLARHVADDGALPRWNPQDFGGVPTVGDPQAGIYNPLYWLLALAPSGHGFGLLIVAYALAGALGFQRYARAHGLSAAAAAAGAVVFALGGSVLLRLVLPGHIVFGPIFLLPALLLQIERVAHTPRSGTIAGAALLIAFLIVALHPQMLLYTGLLGAVLALPAIARAPAPGRAACAVGGAAALAVALAAVHLAPVLALAEEFSRGQPAFGSATPGLAHSPPDLAWLGAIVHRTPGTTLEWESHLHLGAVGFFLAGLGTFAWPRHHARARLAWTHAALALALLAFALGSGTALGPFRIPIRAVVLLGFPLAMLTALGVDALSATPERRRAIATGTAWIAALLLVLAGSDELPLFLLVAAGGGALLVGATAPAADQPPDAPVPWARLAGAACLIGLLAWDTGRIVAPWVVTAPETELHALAPGVTLPDRAGMQRIVELERGAVAPGIPELAVRRERIETLSGYNPLIPWRFVLFASRATGLDPFAYHFDIAVPLIEEAAPTLFDLLGVTHLLRPLSEAPPSWQWRERATALPRAYLVPHPVVVPAKAEEDPIDTARAALERLVTLDPRETVLVHGADGAAALARHTDETAFAPFRAVPVGARTAHTLALSLTLARPGVLVLNEPFVRGWRAVIDGEPHPVLRMNVLFRGLVLEPGTHDIRLEYAPGSWLWGRRVSGLALLLILLMLGWSARRTR